MRWFSSVALLLYLSLLCATQPGQAAHTALTSLSDYQFNAALPQLTTCILHSETNVNDEQDTALPIRKRCATPVSHFQPHPLTLTPFFAATIVTPFPRGPPA